MWLNGTHVGGNEGAETPFVVDVTGALRPGAANLLAVRSAEIPQVLVRPDLLALRPAGQP